MEKTPRQELVCLNGTRGLQKNRGCGRWRKTWPSGNDDDWCKCGKVRAQVTKDRCLGIRMIAEELNMDRETATQVLMTN